jgi:hypothetical protein
MVDGADGQRQDAENGKRSIIDYRGLHGKTSNDDSAGGI